MKFSDTTSSVSEGWLSYGTIDVGHQWVLKQGAVTLGVFAGYGRWTEQVRSLGRDGHRRPDRRHRPQRQGDRERSDAGARCASGFPEQFIFGRARLAVDLALIPYAKYRNEDSHLLRQSPSDLGPAPNIVMEGDGRGIQLDAEFGYEIHRRTIVALGWRYWYLESTDGKRKLPNDLSFPELPVTELYSKRMGATLSVRHLW